MGKCLLLIFLYKQQQETGNIGYASFVHFTVWGPFFARVGGGREGGQSKKNSLDRREEKCDPVEVKFQKPNLLPYLCNHT